MNPETDPKLRCISSIEFDDEHRRLLVDFIRRESGKNKHKYASIRFREPRDHLYDVLKQISQSNSPVSAEHLADSLSHGGITLEPKAVYDGLIFVREFFTDIYRKSKDLGIREQRNRCRRQLSTADIIVHYCHSDGGPLAGPRVTPNYYVCAELCHALIDVSQPKAPEVDRDYAKALFWLGARENSPSIQYLSQRASHALAQLNSRAPTTYSPYSIQAALQANMIAPYWNTPKLFRTEGPMWIDFEKRDYLYIRREAKALLNELIKARIVAIRGHAGAGITTLLRHLGYMWTKECSEAVWYVDARAHSSKAPTINDLTHDLGRGLLIVDDAHLDNAHKYVVDLLESTAQCSLLFGIRDISKHYISPKIRTVLEDSVLIQYSHAVAHHLLKKASLLLSTDTDSISGVLSNIMPSWRTDHVSMSAILQIMINEKTVFISRRIIDDWVFGRLTTKYLGAHMIPKSELVLLPLAIMYQYEIPMHEDFARNILQEQNVNVEECKNIINSLEKHGEVCRYGNNYIGLSHSSIAKLYMLLEHSLNGKEIFGNMKDRYAACGDGDWEIGLWNKYIRYLSNIDTEKCAYYIFKATFNRTGSKLATSDNNSGDIPRYLKNQINSAAEFLGKLFKSLGNDVDILANNIYCVNNEYDTFLLSIADLLKWSEMYGIDNTHEYSMHIRRGISIIANNLKTKLKKREISNTATVSAFVKYML